MFWSGITKGAELLPESFEDLIKLPSLRVNNRQQESRSALCEWPVVGPLGWGWRAPRPFPTSKPNEEEGSEPAFTLYLSESLALGLRESLAREAKEPITPLPLDTGLESATRGGSGLLTLEGCLERLLTIGLGLGSTNTSFSGSDLEPKPARLRSKSTHSRQGETSVFRHTNVTLRDRKSKLSPTSPLSFLERTPPTEDRMLLQYLCIRPIPNHLLRRFQSVRWHTSTQAIR
jgi:hypothetical protein